MAEIPVTRKSNKSWLWLLLLLLVVLALIWWIFSQENENTPPVTQPAAVEQGDVSAGQITETMTIAAVLENPQSYFGRDGFTAEVDVEGPLTDRGFWITDDAGNRMLALVIDEPREVPIDINPGQRLRISGGTIRNPADVSNIPGVPLKNETIQIMRGEPAVLVVDESNIEIIQQG